MKDITTYEVKNIEMEEEKKLVQAYDVDGIEVFIPLGSTVAAVLPLLHADAILDKFGDSLKKSELISSAGAPYIGMLYATSKRAKLSKLDLTSAVYTVDALPGPQNPSKVPHFVAQPNWLANLLGKCKIQYDRDEAKEALRVEPIAVVRCSRGGKTRSLTELGIKLHAESIPVLFVSFNHFSTFADEEQSNPLAALCLRIGFLAMGATDFDVFRKAFSVSPESVVAWLGSSPCVLILDELNRAEALNTKTKAGTEFTDFIRTHFLQPSCRMFVFSSHVMSTPTHLEEYMAGSKSGREVILQQLPLISSLKEAQMYLSPDLVAEEALYCGLIPALVYSKSKDNNNAPLNLQPGSIDDTEFLALLSSFITGSTHNIPTVLLPYFDTALTTSKPLKRELKWIMWHAHDIFRQLRDHVGLSQDMQQMARYLYTLIDNLSGDGFEVLIGFTLIVRILTKLHVDPLMTGYSINSSVSLNRFFIVSTKYNIASAADFEELSTIIATPKDVSFPHVAIYWPRHPRFLHYDFLIYYYESATVPPVISGIQSKQGEEIPSIKANSKITQSFVIQGSAHAQTDLRGWYVVSATDLETFFGVSGGLWMPERLKKLCE